jgi:hypothetical protein
MPCYGFDRAGDKVFLENTQDLHADLEDMGEAIRKGRLLPSLTLFLVKNSEEYRKEYDKFMAYSAREIHRIGEATSQADFSTDTFFDVIGSIHNDPLPTREEDLASYNIPRPEVPLLKELNDTLLNMPRPADDFSLRSQEPVRYEPNYEDYGGIDSNLDPQPIYLTPTNIFARAAQKLNSLERNMKQYNMKDDLKISSFKSNSEYFGPDTIQSAKERLPKLKKILAVKNEKSASNKRTQQDSHPKLDLSVPISKVLGEESILRQIKGLDGEDKLVQKKSRLKPQANDTSLENIDHKFVLPLEYAIGLSDFNCLFTRDLRDFNLQVQMPVIDKLEHDPGQNQEMPHPVMHDEDCGIDDELPQPGDHMNFDNGGDYSQAPMDDESNIPLPEGDLTGLNLLTNYLNIKPDENLLTLEKKLAQNHSFKITEFKKYITEKYISKLQDGTLDRESGLISQSVGNHGKGQGLSFFSFSRDIIRYWQKFHDVKITLQTCFLTVLHLCVEHNLLLQKSQSSSGDFIITLPT